jgi:HD-GYP domain-containing protein (c-di-GMP phosphodiesterase class II)
MYYHPVNVAILSLVTGRRLGFTKRMLSDLGMASLFHDMGKLDIPVEIMNKSERLTPDEIAEIKKAPLYTIKYLIRLKDLNLAGLQRMIVAFEHKIPYYKAAVKKSTEGGEALSLYSRIVSIADCFDAMTTSRPYREAYLPDEALRIMLTKDARKFDPILLKVFVNVVGIYPVGTVVLLDTNELGIVFHNSSDPTKYNRPKILMVQDSSGKRVKSKGLLDLSQKDPSGRYLRSIVRSVDPSKANINVFEHFMAA